MRSRDNLQKDCLCLVVRSISEVADGLYRFDDALLSSPHPAKHTLAPQLQHNLHQLRCRGDLRRLQIIRKAPVRGDTAQSQLGRVVSAPIAAVEQQVYADCKPQPSSPCSLEAPLYPWYRVENSGYTG